jgi:transposase
VVLALLAAHHIFHVSRIKVKEWFRRFKERGTSVESDERSGRPSTSRN